MAALKRASLVCIALAGAAWLLWPLLRPQVAPAAGEPWLVVLDGYHRLDYALALQRRTYQRLLLITCPATGQPTARQLGAANPPLVVLLHGSDTAHQAVVLAHWLERRRTSEHLSLPTRIDLVSDRHHFPRAAWAFQLAVGGFGTQVQPRVAAASVPSDPSPWPTWRDALRIQLWRATGSTGAFLAPAHAWAKQRACFTDSRAV